MKCIQTAPSKTCSNRYRPRSDNRTTINAIIFVLITGCSRWIDLPTKHGSKLLAVHKRFQNLQQKGIWKKILKCAIKSVAHKQNKINLRNISVNSSNYPYQKRDAIK